MTGINNIQGGISSITNGQGVFQEAKLNQEVSKFQSLLDSMSKESKNTNVNIETVSSSQIVSNSRIQGDYLSSFENTFVNPSDKEALPRGAAANSAINVKNPQTIDRTSVLYEKSLELESYFVKMMLNSMKSTVNTSGLMGKGNEFAHNMYNDMFYDELAISMTKNAGFGLADQIYLQLSNS